MHPTHAPFSHPWRVVEVIVISKLGDLAKRIRVEAHKVLESAKVRIITTILVDGQNPAFLLR
jgi:hypothetical protein